MFVLNYLSNLAIPMTILIIVVCGTMEKIKVFDEFLYGAKDGLEMVFKIFPTLVGLFVAISALRESGLIESVINVIKPLISFFEIPTEIMPLAILRPISRKCISCDRNRYYE